MDLSIVIVNWNAKDYLENCLKSIYRETEDLAFEVFVVDNASSDGSREMIKKAFPQVSLIEEPENVGFARANNRALPECRGRYVLLLNPDTAVVDRCLEKMWNFMEQRPNAGAAGCRILNTQGDLDRFHSAKRFPTPFSKFFVDVHLDRIFLLGRFFGKYSIAGWDRSDEREIDVLSGAFMFVRRESIEEVGFLDERFFLLVEDIDWCRRIKEKGWKILFNPHAEIIHHSGISIDRVKSTRIKNAIFSYLIYFQKHHRRADRLVFRILEGIVHGLKVIKWFFRLIVGTNKKLSLANLNTHFKAIFYCFTARTGLKEG
jgi:GT2 family glycosyltransferase